MTPPSTTLQSAGWSGSPSPSTLKPSFELAQADHEHAEAHGEAEHAAPAAEAAHGEAAPASDHAPAEVHAAADHGADAHGETAHAADAHGAHSEAPAPYKLPEELPNAFTLVTKLRAGAHGHGDGHHGESILNGPFAVHGPFWANPAFSLLYSIIVVAAIRRILRRHNLERPTRGQAFLEVVFGGLYDFFGDIFGSEENARKYVPFVGSIWIFIAFNNLFGLFPLLKSPTAHFWWAIGMGLCVFAYVNYNGIKAGGLGHYLWHLCGSPESGAAWIFAPLIFMLELIGTFIKPISLALRLSGNIFGEDKLLAAFLGLGMLSVGAIFGTPNPTWGLPLHLPFLFLAVLTSFIQATVFALLSTVYIAMLLPHHDHEHEDDEHGGHAAAH